MLYNRASETSLSPSRGKNVWKRLNETIAVIIVTKGKQCFFSIGYARGGQLNVTLCYIVTLFAIYYASEGHRVRQ